MKTLKLLSFAAALAVLPQAGHAEDARRPQQPRSRTESPRQVVDPAVIIRGNAALGGNNANSAFGDNGADSNANGRTSGGAGGMN
jgi:hypothetical protein